MRIALAACLAASLFSLGRLASAQHAVRPAGAAQEVSPPSRVLMGIERVHRNLRSTRYVHETHIDERTGQYNFDCSAMASFILARSAPLAREAVMRQNGRGRPVARDFHDVIVAAPFG